MRTPSLVAKLLDDNQSLKERVKELEEQVKELQAKLDNLTGD